MAGKSAQLCIGFALSCVATLTAVVTNVHAGDEAVNCRIEIVETKDIYAGIPKCDATYKVETCEPTPNGFKEISTPYTETLTGDYLESTNSSVNLSKLVFYNESFGAGSNACTIPETVAETIRCTAKLDFLETLPVKEEVCDYTPQTRPRDAGFGNVYASASDRDGHIVNYEWWVDGVKLPDNSRSINIKREFYSDERPRNVKVRVTDDDGYTDESSVSASPYTPRNCDGRRC